jgi:hypothetical protein
MSQESVELLRKANDAFNRLDLDAFVAFLSPVVVWEMNPELPDLREVYRGRAQVRELQEELLELGESVHVELARITELSDDRVFTETVVTGRGKGSDIRLSCVTGRCSGSRRARSQGVRCRWNERTPSKRPGCRSRPASQAVPVRVSRQPSPLPWVPASPDTRRIAGPAHMLRTPAWPVILPVNVRVSWARTPGEARPS